MITKDMFADLTAKDVADFWTENPNNQIPFIGETLFPNVKQQESTIAWYKGDNAMPAPLNPSAFDAKAIARERGGFAKITDNTRYFKEKYYLDEDIRQKLIKVQNTNDQGAKDSILSYIYNDASKLISAAQIATERMRIQVLTTGKIDIQGNGQRYQADYKMKDNHNVTVGKSWLEDDSNPYLDIQKAMDTINEDSGLTATRVLMNSATYRALQTNSSIKSTVLNPGSNVAAVTLSNQLLDSYLAGLGLKVQIYNKFYVDENGARHKFIKDGQVIFMPDGDLGNTVYSTTPEEADLFADSSSDVKLANQVAVSTFFDQDPVNKVIKVSQMVMPSFQQIDSVYVLNGATEPKSGRSGNSDNSDELTQAKADLTNAKRNLTNAQKGDNQDKINEAQTTVDNAQAKVDELSK